MFIDTGKNVFGILLYGKKRIIKYVRFYFIENVFVYGFMRVKANDFY